MTQKIYYDSAYTRDWHTTVTGRVDKEDGIYVTLAETAFYPHGGGQPCDLGQIGGIAVLDVNIEDGEVWHKLERAPEQTEVHCEIDWERRFDHMQQHTGQHLLSAITLKLTEAMTLSFHLGTEYDTIDVAAPELGANQLTAIEQEVNRQIYRNARINTSWVTAEEAAQLPLVKQPTVTEGIRIVEIEGVEYNACGGTHVSATGEIGIIKLLKTEKVKGGTRIYFKCGTRALNEFTATQNVLNSIMVKLKTSKDELLERIEKMELEQKQLQTELNAVKTTNDAYYAEELLAARQGLVIAQVFEDKSLKDMQSLATKLTADHEGLVLFASISEAKVVLAQNGQPPEWACGPFFKGNLGAYNGKGGGSEKMAQAGFASSEDALAFYEFTKDQLGHH
ncbi:MULTISPECIES: alanyl-tRNA editing protein [unclassified Paenibacillus]|uniref:alanyl-tRNA editing protein n=1 Tax=unclassified Paenibacillus TaxID=185978 RepID=UPI000CFC54B6|nr:MULTISPECIES: alanyl-tRNA editing protein [unclassified Paenibacillus]PRA02850.1 hydrolase [Paenibacillus sp. MYb63]PRA45657.1 hydrolase [Paenibacillus sp. MYb67]QZN77972.1 alanyl-tRNA editing protein [Paenibacillus sp. DR312]